jgi:hypothetical protein
MLVISCFTSTYILPGYTDKKEKRNFPHKNKEIQVGSFAKSSMRIEERLPNMRKRAKIFNYACGGR